MKASLDIPDDVAAEVRRRADRDGRELNEQIVRLVKLGLLVVVADPDSEVPAAPRVPHPGRPLPLVVDPATGLPVIHSPPDAPAHSMSVDEIVALARDALSEDDLERAGLPVRH